MHDAFAASFAKGLAVANGDLRAVDGDHPIQAKPCQPAADRFDG
jgi:hypothetical protein